MSEQPKKTVGGMNGGWAFLFKASLVFFPLLVSGIIALGAAVFAELKSHEQRIGRVEASQISMDRRDQVTAQLATLISQVDNLDKRIERIERKIP